MPTLLALAGATFTLALPAAFAQEAVRADSSGTLLTPLSLGSPQVVGKLSPDHLGTGTPTSTTVLRGDGTWVGTTPTGATIASKGALLMGDDSGNAAAVADTITLARVGKVRLEAQLATDTAPVNLLTPTNLTGGTVNPDGTITIPANGSVQWSIPVNASDVANTPLYGYAVATADAPYGALRFRANYGVDHDSEAADSTLLPGAYRTRFLNLVGVGAYNVFLRNNAASPVTVFFPVVATQDTGLALLASHADGTPVSAQPVADLDFTRFADNGGALARCQFERLTTLAADSVGGSSANDGSLYAPTLALPSSMLANGSVLGLYRGSTFRASLPLPSVGTTHGIIVQDVALGSSKPLPVISALDQAPNSSFTSNGDSTFSYSWVPNETLSNDGYANVYVVEINTGTEAVTPIASRHRMPDAASQSSVVSTAGSAFLQQANGIWTATVHPTDGQAPGSGVYRYEVVARVQPANWGTQTSNPGDGALSGLELVGGGSGYGSLGGPSHFTGDRLAFVHSTTHGAVIGGGSLQRSVFYETGHGTSAAGSCIQLTWYADNGAGLSWTLDRCIFYANAGQDPANCLISHTGGSTSYARGDIMASAFLGVRRPDGSLQGTAIDHSALAGEVDRIYVEGIRDVFGNAMPAPLETKGSVFRAVHRVLAFGQMHDNLVQVVNGAGPGDSNNRSPVAVTFGSSGASATNNLFWAHTETASGLGDDQVGGISNATGYTGCTCARNILVLDPANTTLAQVYASLPNDGTAGFTIDYNLVINLAKAGFAATDGTTNFFSWSDYVNATGHDQHSLYLDLSRDPRGLQAVFADPANGDFRWAQTEVARRCAAYCRANRVGPAAVTSRWPVVPTVDEAVRQLSDR